jgi:hypothetical protein
MLGATSQTAWGAGTISTLGIRFQWALYTTEPTHRPGERSTNRCVKASGSHGYDAHLAAACCSTQLESITLRNYEQADTADERWGALCKCRLISQAARSPGSPNSCGGVLTNGVFGNNVTLMSQRLYLSVAHLNSRPPSCQSAILVKRVNPGRQPHLGRLGAAGRVDGRIR